MAKEYIEREASLNESICRRCFHSYVCEQFNEHRNSDNQKCHFFNDHFVPAADVVEVVHAEWIDIRFDPMWRSMSATCSHCKVRGEVRVKSNECGFAVPDSNHCPNCGARMDGEG